MSTFVGFTYWPILRAAPMAVLRFIAIGTTVGTMTVSSAASATDSNTSQPLTPLAASVISSCQAIMVSGKPTWPIDDIDALLPDTLTSSPFRNPRGQIGTRLSGTLNDGTNVVWTAIKSADTVVAMQVFSSIDERPLMFWRLDNHCELTQQRAIIYDEKLSAIKLVITNPVDGSVEAMEPLNPPVPSPTTNVTPTPVEETAKVRVALVGVGVNYTLPQINNRLARDDSGALIGFDFWDNDAQPFDVQFGPSAFHVIRQGTRTASLLLEEAPFVELVPYRYPRPDMSKMRALVEHAALNNIRIVGIPLAGNSADEWQSFSDAAAEHPDILFIASAGNNGRNIDQQPVYPAAFDLANLLVVTSADDFVVPANRVNWGRAHVDYMLPAEQRTTLNFFGQPTKVSGSNIAVPRAMAMAARWLRDNPTWRAPELIAEFANRYAENSSARYVEGGYIPDPLAEDNMAIELIGVQTLTSDKPDDDETEQSSFKLPLSVFVLTDRWPMELVNQSLYLAENILSQCNIAFNSVTITQLSVPDYLKDLETGSSKTLIMALDNDSEFKPIKVFFARNTNMLLADNDASFARSNTRRRSWLQDSAWLMENVEHAGELLAHDLIHVLSNTNGHNRSTNNLMQPTITADSVEIQPLQCEAAINQGKNSVLLFD